MRGEKDIHDMLDTARGNRSQIGIEKCRPHWMRGNKFVRRKIIDEFVALIEFATHRAQNGFGIYGCRQDMPA